MRVAFVGKGGSGKTTLAASLARHLAAKRLPVLAIDADINQHLASAIGMPVSASPLPPMGNEMHRIKEYLKGENPRIRSAATMIKTTPPGTGSRLVRFSESNPVFDYFERRHDGIRLMAVGEFTEEDLGIKCYHSKTGAVELLLNHLVDGEREYAIVDMTAGSDSFASGLFTKFDYTFLVVEPTLKSVGVYEQYRQYARDYDVNIKVVGNKVENEDDEAFIRKRVGDNLVGLFTASPYIRGMEKGTQRPITELEPQNQKALDDVIATIDSGTKNWRSLYEHAVHFHRKNAESWANSAVGEDVTDQIDPSFDIERAIA